MKKGGKSKALRVQLPPDQDSDGADTTEQQTNADPPLLYKKRLDPARIRQTRSMPIARLKSGSFTAPATTSLRVPQQDAGGNARRERSWTEDHNGKRSDPGRGQTQNREAQF